MALPSHRSRGSHRFYHDIQLRGPIPPRIVFTPNWVFTQNPAIEKALTDKLQDDAFWTYDPLAQRGVQNFSWLPYLPARQAQILFARWHDQFGIYHPHSWSPALVADRLLLTLHHLKPLMAGRDAPWREGVLNVIARQARHLRRNLKKGSSAPQDMVRIPLAHSLTTLCIPHDPTLGSPIEDQLSIALTAIAEGHIPKSWRDLTQAVEDVCALQNLKAAFASRRLSPPPELKEALKVARLSVGGALFKTSAWHVLPAQREGNQGLLASLALPQRVEAHPLLAQLGLYPLQGKGTSLLADGSHIDTPFAPHAFGFADEMGALVTNCGAPSFLAQSLHPKLKRLYPFLQSAAAASGLDCLRSSPPPYSPANIIREDAPAGQLLTLKHVDGPNEYQRRLWLTADGQALKGEDAFSGAPPLPPYRFHLAPGVKALYEQGNTHISLHRDQGGPWKFTTSHADMTVEESVYAGQDGQLIKTDQIVLIPHRGGIRWAFTKD